VAAVIRQQVVEPREEQALAATIPALTPVLSDVSRQVREMYEENPYPRWVKVGPVTTLPLPNVMRRTFPRAAIAPAPNAEAPQILVAGCGTGRHPLLSARQFAGARVLAMDLSLASLAYAKRKAQELGVRNIEFAQGDVLELKDRSFDVVEAAGSLQCMDDPQDATRRLTAMLRPGGLFRFGLYSATARRGLAAGRALGDSYPHTTEGIRAFRQAILNAPAGDPLREALTYLDFYTTSMCRDLLLHVKEHVHTLPQIKALLAENGLAFLGFNVPPEMMALYRSRYPDDPAAVDLDNWHALEAERPETFRGMYQFWAQKAAG
jgi:SAM-dependent methyltransferase